MKTIDALYVFDSESKPGKQYQTLKYADGTTSCDCPGWKFKRKTAGGERTCRHTRLVDAGLAEQHAARVKRYTNTGGTIPTTAANPSVSAIDSANVKSRMITIEED